MDELRGATSHPRVSIVVAHQDVFGDCILQQPLIYQIEVGNSKHPSTRVPLFVHDLNIVLRHWDNIWESIPHSSELNFLRRPFLLSYIVLYMPVYGEQKQKPTTTLGNLKYTLRMGDTTPTCVGLYMYMCRHCPGNEAH